MGIIAMMIGVCGLHVQAQGLSVTIDLVEYGVWHDEWGVHSSKLDSIMILKKPMIKQKTHPPRRRHQELVGSNTKPCIPRVRPISKIQRSSEYFGCGVVV